jgi:hypothetical protein
MWGQTDEKVVSHKRTCQKACYIHWGFEKTWKFRSLALDICVISKAFRRNARQQPAYLCFSQVLIDICDLQDKSNTVRALPGLKRLVPTAQHRA